MGKASVKAIRVVRDANEAMEVLDQIWRCAKEAKDILACTI